MNEEVEYIPWAAVLSGEFNLRNSGPGEPGGPSGPQGLGGSVRNCSRRHVLLNQRG